MVSSQFTQRAHSVHDSFWFLVYREKYVGRAEDSQGTWGKLDQYSSNVCFSLYNSNFWPLRLTWKHNEYLFEWLKPICLPFVIHLRWLGLSIQKNIQPFKWQLLSLWKNIHSDGGGFPFKKIFSCSLVHLIQPSVWKKDNFSCWAVYNHQFNTFSLAIWKAASPVWNFSLAVRTAGIICLNKIFL